jgi:carbonic anhydrase
MNGLTKFPARPVDGYRSFVDTRPPLERSRFEKLAASGERPDVMVICCCDSRVSLEAIFDAHPGGFFVVHNGPAAKENAGRDARTIFDGPAQLVLSASKAPCQ